MTEEEKREKNNAAARKYKETHKEAITINRKEYYEKNKEKIKEHSKEYGKQQHIKMQSLLYSIKAERGCYHCGEDDPTMLSFHHLDPSTKKYLISSKRLFNPDKFWEEVNKCICLCLNCHSKLHQEENKNV
jgi:hypothetical protein